ncbi:asparagine synthase (glutamine-hydrolyzing) [Sphingopyxis sp. OAS728]|uniref:asparagine synthase-related protein n=1 Tax=Sphingopyxis sp. OAS728 TaxID=2663823 RepID=UPI001789005F|nr:asparagine synthetase B family protein [Sphingopyxis sp. OAS728]MBE1527937.1 asparagine synthase (glutamine-hydrolyzing) [Sphingopyxis sp. OAS728]
MSFWFRAEVAAGGLSPTADSESAPDYATPSLRVWSGLPLISLGRAGCIAGYLFRRESPCGRITELDPSAQQRIIATRGASLLDEYWGGYVALFIEPNGGVHMLRDPSGMLPCYVARSGASVRAASDMPALVEPGAARVDFSVLARMFASVDALGRKTGIAGIEELLPGECLSTTSTGSAINTAWSPWTHVRRRPTMSFADTAEELRCVVKDTVGAWTICFDSILLGVSGGVDSSIVAASAVPRTPGLRCLTMAEPGTDGDERRYAEALARQLGVGLNARFYDVATIDLARAVLPHSSIPSGSHLMQAIAAVHAALDEEKPVDAYFTGNGGDNVFCNMHSAAPLADRFLASGPTPGLFATARDLADLTGSPLATVWAHGWRRLRNRRTSHPIRFDLSGLTIEAGKAAQDASDRHPWLAAAPDTLPGKKAYVAMLARAQKSIELYPRDNAPPQIAPLLSQPILELCLSIPTWYAVRGGRDRAVARAAFAADLPPLVIERRTKGSPSGFLRRLFDAHMPQALELLRGGRLVEAGLLDPAYLERAAEAAWQDDGRDHRILTLCGAETWVRWWEGKT